MKIKLRPEQPGDSGPTEFSEMSDWLADLKAMADEEQATPSPGPAQPRNGAEPRDEVQPLSAAVPEDEGTAADVAPPATPSWTDNDSAPAPGSHQAYGIGETYGAPVSPVEDAAETHGSGAYPVTDSGAYPVSGSDAYPVTGSGAYPTSSSGAYPVAASGPNAVSGPGAYPVSGSGAYPVMGSGADPANGSGAYPVTGSGAYPVTGPHGVPGAGLAPGLDVAGVADEADLRMAAGSGVAGATSGVTATDVSGEADGASADGAYGAGRVGVADVAGVVAEPEPYGAPSELAADLLDDPGADAANVTPVTGVAGATGGVDVTGGSAGAVSSAPYAPPAPPVAPVPPVNPALYAPPMPSVTPAPPAAPPPAVKPAPPVESTPVGALIGDELRTPMVWCELDPGHCVSWHADRAALGVADVRARAIAAGWRIDALGRLTCPQCQQRSTTFRATQQVVLWDRAYALTMAAREAARQGGFPYPQPAFYPR
jgi:hypothetical protein